MPEREYFSLKYVVPGFIFMLVVVGMNFPPLMIFLQFMGATETFGVMLGFLSLFSGSAIGFIVAQMWFMRYHWCRPYGEVFKKHEPLMGRMFGFHHEQGVSEKDKDIRLSVIMDFIALNGSGKRYWEYFQKRWDIVSTLESISTSLLLGSVVSSLLRLFIELLFGIQQGFWMTLHSMCALPLLSKIDLLVMIFTVASVIVIVPVLVYLRKQVLHEYDLMLEAAIRDDALNLRPMLQRAFPKSFGDTKP